MIFSTVKNRLIFKFAGQFVPPSPPKVAKLSWFYIFVFVQAAIKDSCIHKYSGVIPILQLISK
jgi:hypothetical protein